MAQAIEVKRFPGTEKHPGGRLLAVCAAKSRYTAWDDNYGHEDNYRLAALNLATVMNWSGTWRGGTLKNGNMVWVLEEERVIHQKFYQFWVSPSED